MSSMFFDDVEAAKIAVVMERSGQAFYQAAARKAKDPQVRKMFHELAEEEQRHVGQFEALERQLSAERREAGGAERAELDAYVQRLVETQVFSGEGTVARLVEQIDSDIGALGVGMRAERDALLFYQEMINHTDSRAAREAFRKIIDEEREHLVRLAERSEACEGLHG